MLYMHFQGDYTHTRYRNDVGKRASVLLAVIFVSGTAVPRPCEDVPGWRGWQYQGFPHFAYCYTPLQPPTTYLNQPKAFVPSKAYHDQYSPILNGYITGHKCRETNGQRRQAEGQSMRLISVQ
jgi:hypothetical protein